MCNITLMGNPNVGKSTIFNALTGLKQHTGNWTGKTVGIAKGSYKYNGKIYNVYDIPGTYSLVSYSKEEEIAKDFIMNNDNLTIVVCDATNLERNLNLVLQTLEITNRVILCLNLMDEAKKKKIDINIERLSNILKIPVIGISAKSNVGIVELKNLIEENIAKEFDCFKITYDEELEGLLDSINPSRRIALKILQEEKNSDYEERIVGTIVEISENIANACVRYNDKNYAKFDRKIDKILTNKLTGIPIMLIMLFLIFYITIFLSNYPSDWLFKLFNYFEDKIYCLLGFLPLFLRNVLVYGVYKTVGWIVSVMLVPMLIFFPLFTLLEDVGFLPRIAFNLDKSFRKVGSCGKQSLTMCMGFGCNAVGITNTRIIDSKRERLIAILTNSFVPCNGRFPMIIALITMFLVSDNNPLIISLILVLVIMFSVLITLLISKILSLTILKGSASAFTLELPPYRKPEVVKTIVRSVYDRTLVIMGKSILIAIPSGVIIYLLANLRIDNVSILSYLVNVLNPFAKVFGLDGVILSSFVLGFPANEIVVPIMMMGYSNLSVLSEYTSLESLKVLFVSNGWTVITCVCVIIFCLLHFPCATSLMAIKRETKSIKWTLLSVVIPLTLGLVLCFMVNLIGNLF